MRRVICLIAIIAFCACLLSVGLISEAQTEEPVSMSPHRIILNAQGQFDDVQAIVGMYLPSTAIVDFDVSLSFDGVEVARAESARYCPLDYNLLVGFDRTSLQLNEDVIAMAGQTVSATVAGSVTVLDDGVEYTKVFAGSDDVEIVKPGKK